MMVLGSSGEKLDIASSCLAVRGILGFRRVPSLFYRFESVQTVPETTVLSATFQPSQWVEAAFLVTGKEAVTVEEVRPGHFNSLKGMGTILLQCLTCAATGFDHLVVLAGRGKY